MIRQRTFAGIGGLIRLILRRDRVRIPIWILALVGFTSSFAVVLAGLRAVGATPDQAASGLLALCVTQAVGILWLTTRHRTPLTLAWSTPGAALLVSTGAVAGGWPAAVGAFCVVGGLVLLTALWPRLGDLVAAIPTPIAQAMLAGVLLTLCLAPVRAVVATPLLVAPVIVTWLVLLRVSPRWAAPAALAVTLAIVGYEAVHGGTLAWSDAVPRLDLTAPTLSWQAVVGLAVPLYVVTMASQNVPGVAVMASFGYRVPWRETMTVTGLATLAGATAGGHAINLAAISAALAAGPEAHPDPRRRWVAAHTAGWAYLVLAVGSTHAFGGLKGTTEALARFVRPGGLALVGEGFWERPPTPELAAEIGVFPDLAGTIAEAESGGWLTVHAHVSDRAEWDDYEFSWTGSLARWAAEHPGPDGDEALRAAREHRDMWLGGYRGLLGFVTLLLRRS